KPGLKNFSMNMYDDQITVILGPAYSGKSYALNLLSRSFSADGGSVRIDNRDTRTGMNRSILGLAPQHNALFRNMSVWQHTKFYSSLRRSAWGLKFKNNSTDRYLRCLDLWNVRDIKSRNLTRPERKKLAVANAFAMNPRILLLDEPTEGLEPCERRRVWNLLRSEKRCRTIIMTTYHMDEADILADRVGILCNGMMIFNGSSVFLKNCYGRGYSLVCSQDIIYQEPRITSLVSKYVPNAVASSESDCELAYSIPQSSCSGIPPLLHALESPAQCLTINTLQIGTTPIEDKYIKASKGNKNATSYRAECVECDFVYLSLLCLSIFTGFFTAFLIRERNVGFKLMQKVQGINMATFWLAHLLWDWLFLTLFAAVLVALWSFILQKGFSDTMSKCP
ncbi:hypothetical protein KR032_002288, partial [Drosophila birchii]